MLLKTLRIALKRDIREAIMLNGFYKPGTVTKLGKILFYTHLLKALR